MKLTTKTINKNTYHNCNITHSVEKTNYKIFHQNTSSQTTTGAAPAKSKSKFALSTTSFCLQIFIFLAQPTPTQSVAPPPYACVQMAETAQGVLTH